MVLQVVQPGQTRTRVSRRPNFPIAGTLVPFGLYPIMCHPVLPGETLKSAVTRWRVLSMPIVHPLAGAWLKSWLFYVKLTDISRDLGQMFVSDSYSTSGWTASGHSARYFVKSGKIKWVQECLERCVEAFFLNQGETTRTIDGVPMAKLNQVSWMQNLMFRGSETATDTSSAGDTYADLSGWQMLQQMQMTELTYEKYLETYGVKSVNLATGQPEILRYSRSWTQPVNHVNPADGTPASAWVWSNEMKMEKDKRFDEPGFLLQVACIRPKLLQAGILTSMVGNLWGFTDWFPSYQLSDPTAGVRQIQTTDSIFDAALNASEGAATLLYDHRDLLTHGEQFVNDRTNNPYTLPEASAMSLLAAATPEDVRGEYANSTDVNDLFVGATTATRLCYYEGMTQLVISGQVMDSTPRG